MSLYTLPVYLWSAVAALGVVAPFAFLAVEFIARSAKSWLSALLDREEPIISSRRPISSP